VTTAVVVVVVVVVTVVFCVGAEEPKKSSRGPLHAIAGATIFLSVSVSCHQLASFVNM
jgi:ABC-type Co2+ transport system permease subunit